MRAFILLIFLFVISWISTKTYNDFDDKVSPSFIGRCTEWGGKAAIAERFNLECVKENKQHNIDIEKEYRYIFYGVLSFFGLLILILLFSFQGNKNDD